MMYVICWWFWCMAWWIWLRFLHFRFSGILLGEDDENACQKQFDPYFSISFFKFVFPASLAQSRCATALNETTVFWSCCKELQKRHYLNINSFYFISFFHFPFHFDPWFRKFITNSFLVQILWGFLHYSPCDV